jgi:hypothetical protein
MEKMIKSIATAQILDNPILPFASRKGHLSDAEKAAVSGKRVFHYKFEEDVYTVEQDLFFKTLMGRFMAASHLYFYYIDKMAEQKSRLRSHKKLLYAHREAIDQANLYEEEVALGQGKTILYSIVRVDKSNVDYVCKHLINSLFSFGLVKDGNQQKDWLEGLRLTDLLQAHPPLSSELFDVNLLSVIGRFVNNQTSLIRLSRDGLDNDYLSLFYESESHLSLMKAMKQQFTIQEVAAK